MNPALGFVLLGLAVLLPLLWWVGAGAFRGHASRAVAIGGVLSCITAVYLLVGRPDAMVSPSDPIDELATKIEQQLDRQPTDVDGWRALGRLRVSQGRFDAGAEAYAKARALTGDEDVAALIGYAEARLLADPSRLTGEVAPLFERALELAPNDSRVLWYSGHLAAERGEVALAERHWRALLALNPPPELRHAVEARLGAAPAGGEPLFEVEVVLAPTLATRQPRGVPLFVVVRDGQGRMPLLARRIMDPKLPLKVALTADDLLGDRAALATAGNLVASARFAVSGTAARGAGDLEGTVSIVRGSPGKARVIIDTEVR